MLRSEALPRNEIPRPSSNETIPSRRPQWRHMKLKILRNKLPPGERNNWWENEKIYNIFDVDNDIVLTNSESEMNMLSGGVRMALVLGHWNNHLILSYSIRNTYINNHCLYYWPKSSNRSSGTYFRLKCEYRYYRYWAWSYRNFEIGHKYTKY